MDADPDLPAAVADLAAAISELADAIKTGLLAAAPYPAVTVIA